MNPWADGTKSEFEEKVWGFVRHKIIHNRLMISELLVNSDFQCSIHKHNYRYNSFVVISGIIQVEIFEILPSFDPMRYTLHEGHSFVVPPHMYHRFKCLERAEILETYWTDKNHVIDINDIVRVNEGGKIDGT